VRSPTLALVAAAVVFMLGGCPGGPETGSECGRGPGSVRLGEGGSRLRDLPESGGALDIVRGSQGGIHVLVGFRVRDMGLEMHAVYRLVDPETGEAVGTPTERALRPTLFNADGADYVRNPDLIVLDNGSDDTTAFAGRNLHLELEAVSDDSHACDLRAVELVDPDA